MSFTLRLSVITVLLLASAALGLLAYNAYLPKVAVEVAQAAPAARSSGYFVAAHPLRVGTLVRDEDLAVRSAPLNGVPSGAILDSPDTKIGLRGSLVREFLDAGAIITAQDVLRPRDRSFLASVLAPGTLAAEIKVDAESGASGLMWPGDYVDVVLTQVNDKADPAHRMLSEVVLHNVRVIAIDQDIVQGAQGKNATVDKQTHSVALQLAPKQVQKIAIAKQLGKLSLAIQAAVRRRQYTGDIGTMFSCDVSPEIARQSAIASEKTTVKVLAGGKTREFSVPREDAGDSVSAGCDISRQMVGQGQALASQVEQ
jgi:pilus assembly protein CpaB